MDKLDVRRKERMSNERRERVQAKEFKGTKTRLMLLVSGNAVLRLCLRGNWPLRLPRVNQAQLLPKTAEAESTSGHEHESHGARLAQFNRNTQQCHNVYMRHPRQPYTEARTSGSTKSPPLMTLLPVLASVASPWASRSLDMSSLGVFRIFAFRT